MITQEIKLNNPEKYSVVKEISKEKLVKAAEIATDRLEALAKRHPTGFPGTCSTNFQYTFGENKNWETGMYTGCYWLAYELTGNKFFRERAEEQLLSFRERLDKRIGVDDHDVGFVFIPSALAAYKVTGSEYAYKLACDAAEYLYSPNYSEEGKFIIRYHGGWNTGWGCRTMMDSLMNAPLLFWASKELGREDLYRAATNKTAVLCGPPIMIKFTLDGLVAMGFDKTQVYTTLELRMKCGVGKCGRCNVGAKYVCKDGPVFRCDELEELPSEY